MSSSIYLDHAATTPLAPEVVQAMAPYLESAYGNPSSIHRYGKKARRALEEARTTVAQCLGANADELVFTSGGTEADNLAVLGVTRALLEKPETSAKRHLITTAIEHSAVAKPFAYLEKTQGYRVTYLGVDAEGIVSLEDVRSALSEETVLVSVMHANNEIGSIQPIEAIGELLRQHGILFHSDAVQTAGKLPLDVNKLNVDYLSLSAHKLYGPKGVGALYVRRRSLAPVPLIFGGGQESGFRSGTENVAGCVGFAEALKLACASMAEESDRLRALQRYFIDGVLEKVPSAVLNGPSDLSKRVPGNVNFSFPPGEGEALVLQLDLKGVAASTGSACKSTSIAPSPIVLATGKPEPIAQASVRFSMGHHTTREMLDEVVETLYSLMVRYREKMPLV
ncbi:MAG: cysteine desulfurase family protein [Vampirovibrionales bacterium]|nr:cysteine desulfurase family protein [Vampirovibrionales bacterium]